MSMLAEPRRKQKVINLRAKNNAWSNDATKFGQRMLEKMGWSSGKGLGAKENGIVEHVVARYKNDEKGLGFEDKNDQWTKHEDDFNALLANLSNDDSKEIKLHSGISLEEKSKNSRARIHYHKFTRGKDLSRYSEKDLANIFGKKSFKNEAKTEEIKDDPQITEQEQVFTEKGSMEDYFKNKMAAFNSKNKTSCLNNQKSLSKEVDYSFKGFSGTNSEETEETQHGFGLQPFSFYGNNNSKAIEETEMHQQDASSKKRKKNKLKSKDTKSSENGFVLGGNRNEETEELHQGFRYQSSMCHNDKNVEKEPFEEESVSRKKSKKKNKSKANISETTENECILSNKEIPEANQEVNVCSKKNKKKNKLKKKSTEHTENEFVSGANDIIETEIELQENQEENVSKKKKRKLKNHVSEITENDPILDNIIQEPDMEQLTETKVKKSKKRKNVEDETPIHDSREQESETSSKKKKKKSKKETQDVPA